MTEREYEIVEETVVHFEEEGGWAIAVTKQEAIVLYKYLKTYLKFTETNKHKGRPVLISKKKNAVLPKKVGVKVYNCLYNDYKDLADSTYVKLNGFISEWEN
jgi:reverse gyrase